jgi:hypothetical protein
VYGGAQRVWVGAHALAPFYTADNLTEGTLMARTATDKVLSRRVLVNVRRDVYTTSSQIVWQHEIPILEEIHGEGNVTEVDPACMDEGYQARPAPELLPINKTQDQIAKPSTTQGIGYVFFGSAQIEYARLAGAYGRHMDKPLPNVEVIYGRYQDGNFQKVVGQASLTDLPAPQLLELIKAYGHLPEASFDATPEEKAAAAKARKELLAKTQPELIKIAEELGVAVD